MTMTDQQKSKLRTVLMVVVPVVALAIAGVIWLTGGRYETTDNAYVKADRIMLSPEVSGTVLSRAVEENQSVKKGDLLVQIDPEPFEIALAKARADLATARAQVQTLKSDYSQKREQLTADLSDLEYTDAEFERASKLQASGAVSKSSLDEATRNRDAAHAAAALTQREMEGVVAQLDGNPDIRPEEHSSYLAAQAMANQAQLNLLHARIFAPSDGIVSNLPNPGTYARAGVPLLSEIKTDRIWVEANFKETQLEKVKPGQIVAVDVDTYPNRSWKGVVESISPATGSEFSILPAQNATGNWVKVVQRIAVRISIKDTDAGSMLRPGMSAETKIDLQSGS